MGGDSFEKLLEQQADIRREVNLEAMHPSIRYVDIKRLASGTVNIDAQRLDHEGRFERMCLTLDFILEVNLIFEFDSKIGLAKVLGDFIFTHSRQHA